MRILIVDDDPIDAESLADLVELLGHEAHVARSHADAAWLLDLFRFDLALLDFDMPSRTGPEIARWLAGHQRGLPSIILSAHQHTRRRREELAGLPCLAKPVLVDTLSSLLASLARCVEGSPLVPRGGYSVVKYL